MPTLFRSNADPRTHPTATARRGASAMLTRASILIGGAVALCVCASSADATTITFSNTTAITIPATGTGPGAASPYPSNIIVSGFTGDLTDLTLTLTGLTHTFPEDLDILLVGPTGAALLFMSDAGGGADVFNISLTFSDAAASQLPTSQISTGTFRPTNYIDANGTDTFPAPAPASFALAAPVGAGTFANTFGGLDPNGVWSLFVSDDFSADAGLLAGGWSLTITAPTDAAPVPEPASLTLLGLGLAGMVGRRWRQRKAS